MCGWKFVTYRVHSNLSKDYSLEVDFALIPIWLSSLVLLSIVFFHVPNTPRYFHAFIITLDRSYNNNSNNQNYYFCSVFFQSQSGTDQYSPIVFVFVSFLWILSFNQTCFYFILLLFSDSMFFNTSLFGQFYLITLTYKTSIFH